MEQTLDMEHRMTAVEDRSNPHRTTTMNYTIIYALKAWASDALAPLKREREAVYG